MKRIRRKKSFDVKVSRERLERALGYTERPAPARVGHVLDEVIAEAADLIEPAGAFVRLDDALSARSEFLKDLDPVALCLITIGPRLEEAISVYDHQGELGRALILNVCGSEAAEAAADAVCATIRKEMRRDGLRCSRRFSPGYSGWSVAEQPWIIAALDGAALGVTLTSGCMMVPRKSITFAVTFGEDPVEVRADNVCDGCELINCRHRRKAVVVEKEGKQWTTFVAPESDYCPLDKWG